MNDYGELENRIKMLLDSHFEKLQDIMNKYEKDNILNNRFKKNKKQKNWEKKNFYDR